LSGSNRAAPTSCIKIFWCLLWCSSLSFVIKKQSSPCCLGRFFRLSISGPIQLLALKQNTVKRNNLPKGPKTTIKITVSYKNYTLQAARIIINIYIQNVATMVFEKYRTNFGIHLASIWTFNLLSCGRASGEVWSDVLGHTKMRNSSTVGARLNFLGQRWWSYQTLRPDFSSFLLTIHVHNIFRFIKLSLHMKIHRKNWN